MKILVIGGTRMMGKHLIRKLLQNGHKVTIANRGITPDDFGDTVQRLKIERTDGDNLKSVLKGRFYDIVFDCIAFCSNDVKAVLDSVICNKYVFISTTAVYDKHINTREDEFNPLSKPLIWCSRSDFAYAEIKRQAECAVSQAYPDLKFIAVRFPFVIGLDDYTKRLYFYIDHIVNENPMYLDNFDKQMSFVRSDEAGQFLAFLAESDYCGAINGASEQTISLQEIAAYVKLKTGKSPMLSNEGDKAPYNGEREYSINIDIAKGLGFSFTPLKSWVFELIEQYIIDTGFYNQ